MKIAIIPARGGSKRIPNKNIKLFKRIPIISRTIKKLQNSKIFDLIIVSTDSPQIAKIAKKNGVEVPFLRPKKISDDYTDTQTVIRHAIKWLENKNIYTKFVCCVYPTSVFFNQKDLLDGYKKIKKNKWDFVFTAGKSEKSAYHAFEKKKSGGIKILFSKFSQKRSQSIKRTYHDAGHFYWAKPEVWLSNKKIISEKSYPVIISRYRDLDINTLEDWKAAEILWNLRSK
tara:strand:+ start:1004 stop:1690 length:687 start_codon:yes stop_codon:yes gene_type:complete